MVRQQGVTNAGFNHAQDIIQAELPLQLQMSVGVIVLSEHGKEDAAIISILKDAGCCIVSFTPGTPPVGISKSAPSVLLTFVAPGDVSTLTSTIMEMQQYCQSNAAILFLAPSQDISSRLAAYRAGATRYLATPVEADQLISCLAEVAMPSPSIPYRVMLVGDQVDHFASYAKMLRDVGMSVCEINDPFVLVKEEPVSCTPEVLVLCRQMKRCTNTELAFLLRSTKNYAKIPIVYLSKESDVLLELSVSTDHGGSRLGNRVVPNALVAEIMTRARSYRNNQGQTATLMKAEYELKRQQEALDSHAIVSVADASGVIVYVNEKFCQISGYSSKELLGNNHRIVKSGEHDANFFLNMWETISNGKVWQGEVCNRKKNGELYWVETSIVPFIDEHGLPYNYISIRTDITWLKQAELALLKSNLYLEEAQALSKLGNWEVDLSTGNIYWSDEIYRIFGRSKSNFTPSVEAYHGCVHPDDWPMVYEAGVNAAKTAKHDLIHRIVRPDGTIRYIHFISSGEMDEAGHLLYSRGTIQDVTELKLAELNTLQAKELAEAASYAKSAFLASMSHELRTPLNAILGFAQLFNMDTSLSDDARDSAKHIENAGQHLLSLINDMIDLARIESNKVELNIETIHLKDVVFESVSMLQNMANAKGVEIKIVQSQMENVSLRADFVRLRQVFINLLSNAIKYNRPNGSVELSCEIDQDLVRVMVKDGGLGISRDKQSRVFTPFDRLGAERGGIEGTGIGLVITKRIVEAMNGKIGFDSEEGEGTTFWLEFAPVREEQCSSKNEDVSQVKALDKKQDVKSDKKISVLYVEDSLMNVKLMRQVFATRSNWELLIAEDAEKGIEIARSMQPEIILMDINLPGMSGFHAMRNLKQDQLTSHIPIVALTANAMKGDVEEGMNAGFVEYLTKPLDIVKLLGVLDHLLLQTQVE